MGGTARGRRTFNDNKITERNFGRKFKMFTPESFSQFCVCMGKVTLYEEFHSYYCTFKFDDLLPRLDQQQIGNICLAFFRWWASIVLTLYLTPGCVQEEDNSRRKPSRGDSGEAISGGLPEEPHGGADQRQHVQNLSLSLTKLSSRSLQTVLSVPRKSCPRKCLGEAES